MKQILLESSKVKDVDFSFLALDSGLNNLIFFDGGCLDSSIFWWCNWGDAVSLGIRSTFCCTFIGWIVIRFKLCIGESMLMYDFVGELRVVSLCGFVHENTMLNGTTCRCIVSMSFTYKIPKGVCWSILSVLGFCGQTYK